MGVDLDRSILLVAGLAMLALAILVLAARPGRGVNRALAALVAARGAATILPQVSDDPSLVAAAIRVQPYFSLAVLPLAVYCMHAFAREGRPATRARGALAGWMALGAVAALDLAYFLDHALLHGLSTGDADVGALRAAEGLRYTSFGPLWLIVGAAPVALAYLGLRLALQHRASAHGDRSPLLLLLASGLTLGALFEGASRLAALTALLDQPGSFPWFPWGWAVVALPVAALAPALLAVAVIANHRTSSAAPRWAQRRLERTVLVLCGFAFFSGFLRLMAPADSDVAGSAIVLVPMGLWRLAMPLFVAYALVRHPPQRLAQRAPGQASGSLPASAGAALDGRPVVR
ncbi:MAG TPA: hypothetical protein VM241_05145 [Candidatus Thermoplasmatota archaeon]|nr:hypothetical protein [Candidatus Thermoplasmatota archaeon]